MSNAQKPAMLNDADFQTWNNNNAGGGTDPYWGAQGRNNIDANDDSLEVADNTWVIVFDGNNYTGNCLQISPGVYIDDLNNQSRQDGSGNKVGDWKNQIRSFIIYKQQPAFWNASSPWKKPTNTELLALHDGQMIVTEDTGYQGANSTLTAPYNCSDTAAIGYTTNSDHMTGAYAISSMETGPGAWLIIFDQLYEAGNFLKILPGTPYSNLNNVPRTDLSGKTVGDWQDQIHSFLLYPDKPAFWDTSYPRAYVDFPTLYQLYPDSTNDVSDNKVEYTVSDSDYTIDCPDFTAQSTTGDSSDDLPATGWTKYHVNMEHDNNMFIQNDKVNFDAYFDNNGKLVQIENFEWTANGAEQVPDYVIKSVDLIAWYLGTTGALETMGISDEVADDFVNTFNFVCNVFNKIANLVYKATDNGGGFYFLPVVCHTINRICATVASPFHIPVYTDAGNPATNYQMFFSNNRFPDALSTALGSEGSANSWAQKQGAGNVESTFNQVVEFIYNNFQYRTWYQESSVSASLGMFVSCKIDYEISDDSKDDHIILLMGFSIPMQGQTPPVLSFAQAIVQFTDGSNTNIQTNAYNNNVIDSIYNSLTTALANVTADSNQQGRKYIADVTKDNMNAIVACMSYG